MYRVYCNGCFTFYNKDKSFSLTSCGHVYCLQCLPHGNRENCRICNQKFSRMPINKQMPESTLMLFKDMKRTVLSFSKVIRFQTEQSDRFTQHLLKENQRLKRLVICFKKRVEFLSKKSSSNVTSQMYQTIKQEPIDEDYINREYVRKGHIETPSVSMKHDHQLDNIDWNSEMSTEEYDQKTRQYVSSKNFVPQIKSYNTEPNERMIAAEMRKMGINVSLNNLTQFNKRISLGQEQRPEEDSKRWNYPSNMYYNYGPEVEKPLQPQQMRQSTIDQFLCRGNNFINRVASNHFPYNNNNQSMGPIGSGNYPNTVLATRPIDADSIVIKREYS